MYNVSAVKKKMDGFFIYQLFSRENFTTPADQGQHIQLSCFLFTTSMFSLVIQQPVPTR
jgi:hypothetical protein